MTGESCFYQLNERIRDLIKDKEKWPNFRPIQEKAIPLILNKEETLIIAPTASGKTEAALIPVFNDIISNKLEPASVLYVSPLKALINDMYKRVDKWAEYFSLETMKWHGDVSAHRKKSFVENPADFLLITPESLEVLLFKKTLNEKENIFKNIKYVIIDEIHYFIESDRGTQLNSLLKRLETYTQSKPIKLGLSATVGNPQEVAEWMNPQKPAQIVQDDDEAEFYYKIIEYSDERLFKEIKRHISKQEKILIFVKSRNNAEEIGYKLKKEFNYKNIFIHHSSIDKDQREEAENKFKNADGGILVCTSTLELGIDIGDIFCIFQIGPPSNISSLLQRLGRSGRETKERRLKLFFENKEEVLISLAELALLDKNLMENLNVPEKPKDIYFHQILSVTEEYGKIKNKELFELLNDSYVFSKISSKEFKAIVSDMINKEFLSQNGDYLAPGYKFGEEFGKMNFLQFYSVFYPTYEYSIYQKGKLIGTIDPLFILKFKPGETFILNGEEWTIKEIIPEKFKVTVKEGKQDKENIPSWVGSGIPLSYLICREVYDILLNDFDKSLLNEPGRRFDESSMHIIKECINEAAKINFKKGIIPIEIDDKIYIYTFAGHKTNALLLEIFKNEINLSLEDYSGFLIKFKAEKSVTYETIVNILADAENILNDESFRLSLAETMQEFIKNKFIKFMPTEEIVDLNMELLYDEKHLIELLRNNKPEKISNSTFSSWM